MRRLLAPAVLATALTAAFLPANAHAAAVGYMLIAKHSGQCLTAPGSSGTQAYQYPCSYGSSSQTWYFESTSSGWDQLKSAWTGRCLDVSGGGIANGTPIITYACNSNATNQHWSKEIPNLTTGYGEIRSQVNFAVCLDISGASQSPGALTILWQCNSGNNQQWLVVPIGGHI